MSRYENCFSEQINVRKVETKHIMWPCDPVAALQYCTGAVKSVSARFLSCIQPYTATPAETMNYLPPPGVGMTSHKYITLNDLG